MGQFVDYFAADKVGSLSAESFAEMERTFCDNLLAAFAANSALKSTKNCYLGHSALCVIFTILVSFSWDNALFASKAKINVV